MGQKVNPHGLRVGIIKDWDSKWYADKDYEKFLLEDIKNNATTLTFKGEFCCNGFFEGI